MFRWSLFLGITARAVLAAQVQPRSGAQRAFGGGRGGGSYGRGRGGFSPARTGRNEPREHGGNSRANYRMPDTLPEESPYAGFEYLYGVSPVLGALREQRRDSSRLLLQETMQLSKRKDAAAIVEMERLASAAGLPVERIDKGFLNNRCQNRPHQGVVLETQPLDFVPLATLPPAAEGTDGDGARRVWLALDEVSDPQNLGALLRSAHFLGADGVLLAEKNSCPLTPVVSKASAGAMEVMPVHATKNLVKTLEAASRDGWDVVGAALGQSVDPDELDHTRDVVLVLGSEGEGLRTNVLRACSQLVRIPRGGDGDGDSGVDSLNVSVAGGILLYSMLRMGRAA